MRLISIHNASWTWLLYNSTYIIYTENSLNHKKNTFLLTVRISIYLLTTRTFKLSQRTFLLCVGLSTYLSICRTFTLTKHNGFCIAWGSSHISLMRHSLTHKKINCGLSGDLHISSNRMDIDSLASIALLSKFAFPCIYQETMPCWAGCFSPISQYIGEKLTHFSIE